MLSQIFSAPTWRSNSACFISCEGCSLAPQSSSDRPDSWTVSARSRIAPSPVASMAGMFFRGGKREGGRLLGEGKKIAKFRVGERGVGEKRRNWGVPDPLKKK